MPLTRGLRALAKRPREVRDTLLLLAVLAWIQALLLGHVPLWASALGAALLLWRGWLAWRQRPLPGWPWRAGLSVAALAATVAQHRTLLGPDAGVTLVVVLLALKTLELRARRDAWVLFFLAFFALLTPLLRSQALPMALGVAVAVWGLLTALVLAHRPVGAVPVGDAARTAARLMLLGTPLMVVLFALFPRLPPLWGLPLDSTLGRSGLSGQMRVGDVARLALDDRVALRVAFPDGAPPVQALYFRGPVLRVFDGQQWRPLHGPQAAPVVDAAWVHADAAVTRTAAGPPLRYRVTLEPTQRPWLPALEHTLRAPQVQGGAPHAAPLTAPDGAWWLPAPVTDVLRYDAQAHTDVAWGAQADRLALQVDRELPPGYNPRTLAWAQALRRELGGPEPAALVAALLQRLRDGGYRYTLEPGVYGPHSADEFWFDRKAGFCEHIASAFVVALRALDIPARIVTGYQGGEFNPVDGLWTVRHSDAHAWAEVWLPAQGWTRIDPTAWVAPSRTAAGVRLQPPPGPLARAVVQVDPRLLQLARAWWDATNQRWNEWVLDYGPTRQLQLLQRLGWSAQDWRDALRALGAVLGLAAVVAVAWLLWPLRPRRADPWQRWLRLAAQRAAAAGVVPPQPLTPRALATAVRRHPGVPDATARAWEAALLQLEALRYDPAMAASLPAGEQRALRQRLRDLPALTARAPTRRAAGRWLLGVALAAALPLGEPRAQPARTGTGWDEAALRALATSIDRAEGWDDGWAQQWLPRARPDARARALNTPPPATAYPNWAAYRARFVEPRRIAAGVAFWAAHAEALQRAEARWGVPAHVVVGIIGVETLYGRHLGQHRVLDVLTTLALDFPPEHPRAAQRQAMFQDELRALLRLARHSGIAPDAWQGSFAGAMGWPQFMPSSWLAHAVDFDGDGRVDLIGSPVDAIGSVAAFLAAHGWQPDMPVRYAVTPPTHPQALGTLLAPDIRPTFTAAQLRELGAELPPEAQRHPGPLALVLLHNGDPAAGGGAPTYVLGTQNFWALTRYNRSSYYALAVLELGEAVARQRRA